MATRFPPEFTACLKARMLAHYPTCYFQEADYAAMEERFADVDDVMHKARQWAKNFRSRVPDTKKEEYLRSAETAKLTGKASRYHIVGFGLSKNVFEGITFPKRVKAGEADASFEIKLLEAAVDPDATNFECYIEFAQPISENVFHKRLTQLGGVELMSIMFNNDDEGHRHAADAIASVELLGKKKRTTVRFGNRSDSIAARLHIAAAASGAGSASRSGGGGASAPPLSELDEKTARAIQESIRDIHTDVHKSNQVAQQTQNMVGTLPDQVAGAVVPSVTAVGTSIAAVGTSVGDCAVDIKLVLAVVGKLSAAELELSTLKEQLAKQTKLADQAEANTAMQTRKVNLVSKERDAAKLQMEIIQEKYELLREHNEDLRAMRWYAEYKKDAKRQRLAHGQDTAVVPAHTNDDEYQHTPTTIADGLDTLESNNDSDSDNDA